MMTARPQTVGYGAADSPAGLAAWILVHPGFAQWAYGNDPEKSPTKDDVLDNITLYWLTNTAASGGAVTGRTAHEAASSLRLRRRPARYRSQSQLRCFLTTSIEPRRHGPGAPIAT